MRMNRGTVFLIAALLVIIAVVLVINNNQASAPGTTATPQESSGSLFSGMIAGNIVHYEVRDNTAGTYTALTKDSGGAWHIDGTNKLDGRDPDQTLITTTAGQIASIAYNNTFQDDKLDTFGLATPTYTVLVTTSDGALYTIYVGAKAPTSSRYYAVVEQATAPVSTAEAVTPATPEATAEATAAVASKRFFRQATEEATAEATAAPTAEATMEMAAATEAPAAATPEATAEMTAEATVAATADVIANPQVTLSGQKTIYVIPQTVIDTLKRWLVAPPYAALPTATPTLEALTPEVTAEATAAPTAEATAQPTAEATQAATAEAGMTATAEATAAS